MVSGTGNCTETVHSYLSFLNSEPVIQPVIQPASGLDGCYEMDKRDWLMFQTSGDVFETERDVVENDGELVVTDAEGVETAGEMCVPVVKFVGLAVEGNIHGEGAWRRTSGVGRKTGQPGRTVGEAEVARS